MSVKNDNDTDQGGLETLPDSITTWQCDVGDSDALDAIFDEILPDGLDVLVNNAGVSGPTKLVEEITNDEWDQCMSICIDSQFYCARRAVPVFKEQGGVIINMVSAAGIMGYPEDVRKQYAIGTSMQCYVDPQEISDLIAFLASDYGRHISGQIIGVDGNTERCGPANCSYGQSLRFRPTRHYLGVRHESNIGFGRPIACSFADRVRDHECRLIGLLLWHVDEKFVVQAQYDLGVECASVTSDRDCPHLEELGSRTLDQRVTCITAPCRSRRHGTIEVSVLAVTGGHSHASSTAGEDVFGTFARLGGVLQ